MMLATLERVRRAQLTVERLASDLNGGGRCSRAMTGAALLR